LRVYRVYQTSTAVGNPAWNQAVSIEILFLSQTGLIDVNENGIPDVIATDGGTFVGQDKYISPEDR
jgi:hypothetical protein